MPKTSILWGIAPDAGTPAETYEFATQAEVDAFLKGIAEADGWFAYEIVDEGYIHNPADEDDENTCRTCGASYADGGDGFDGECPDCADKTDQKLHPENYQD